MLQGQLASLINLIAFNKVLALWLDEAKTKLNRPGEALNQDSNAAQSCGHVQNPKSFILPFYIGLCVEGAVAVLIPTL